MLVKDEADVIDSVVLHTLAHVDRLIVADNMSADGTRRKLDKLAQLHPALTVVDDDEVGYYQSRKTTALAHRALLEGHEWVIPVDADEVWYSMDGRRLADYLAGVAPDVKAVRAILYNHFPTNADNQAEPDPFRRIRWRHREHQPPQFGKVACRLLPHLQIAMGNHAAWSPAPGNEIVGFEIRHFSWRSPEQYIKKLRNGEKAYAATDFPETTGTHWRMFEGKPDEAIVGQFYEWFHFDNPDGRDDFVLDPAPLAA